jgi:hypothetical protein
MRKRPEAMAVAPGGNAQQDHGFLVNSPDTGAAGITKAGPAVVVEAILGEVKPGGRARGIY